MNQYKLVPVEPTPEMVEAARQHREGEAYLPVSLYKAMLAAAPSVQGEPVGWVTEDTVDGQAVNGKPRRIWWENNEGVGMPIYTAPQPAEQQPAPDVDSQILKLIEDECRYWHGRDEARRGGYANLYAKAKEMISKQQPSPDITQLVEALESVVSYDESAEDDDFNLMFHYSGMMKKVRAALADYRKGGDEE